MKQLPLVLAASLTALAACVTAPAGEGVLAQTASLMVSIVQHGEGMSGADISDLSAQLDAQVAAAPGDPYVLKLAAQSRRALSDHAQDRAQRVELRHTALAELDRAIALSKPDDPARQVALNGMGSAIGFEDLAAMRASLFHQVTTDR
jgi:hypothetical protein